MNGLNRRKRSRTLEGILPALFLALGLVGCAGPRPTTEMSRAVQAEDNAELSRLLKAGRSPEEGELRPITWAARIGDVKAIDLLIAAGASVDRPDGGNGWAPLLHAIHKRQAAAVEALLRAGADPNRRLPNGGFALMMAAANGDLKSIELLLKGGADASFEMQPGINSLWAALGGGALFDITDGPPLGSCYPEVAAVLKKHAPSLRIRQGAETRFLHFVAKGGCASLIDANLR